ncbi:MAG: LysR family transcriptional regulator [Acidaminococcaceae bacterium]|nr:LysR family transcriptional regulator [Acidaminococcaceae bacterium]
MEKIMTLTQLRYFYEAGRFQNISQAANALHVAQPTLSVAIQTLEKETGLHLFYRMGKQIILTEDGHILLAKITPLLERFQQLDEEIEDMAHRKNHIRMAVPLQIGVKLLPALFTDFRREFPDLTFDIVEAGGIDALPMIEQGELDISVTNYDDHFLPSLRYRTIGKSEICFCTSTDHPLATQKSVSVEALQNEPLVLLNGGFFITRRINEIFQEASVSPKVLLYTGQLHTIKLLVQSGQASTFLMRQAVRPEDHIAALSLQPVQRIHTGIVTRCNRPVYRDEERLFQFIRQIVND